MFEGRGAGINGILLLNRLLLAGYTGVLATQEGAVVDIVTRIDLIHYWGSDRNK